MAKKIIAQVARKQSLYYFCTSKASKLSSKEAQVARNQCLYYFCTSKASKLSSKEAQVARKKAEEEMGASVFVLLYQQSK
jgi:ribosomal protein L24E